MCMVVRLLRIYPEQSIVQFVAGVRTLTLHISVCKLSYFPTYLATRDNGRKLYS